MMRVETFDGSAWDAARERGASAETKSGRDLLVVIGRSKQHANGADWIECFVDSGSRVELRHRVVIAGARSGVAFTCDCEAHQYGRLCWHVARALDELDLGALTRLL
jgi:hypothetical protein